MRLKHAIAALAQRECRMVLRALADTRDPHRSVHEARKAIRRLRSVLTLVRDDLGDQVDPIDKAIKRLGDGLSPLRDAQAVIATAKKMSEAKGEALWPAIVERLTARRDVLLEDTLARDADFQRRRNRTAIIEQSLQSLPWAHVRKHSVQAALKQSARRVEKAWARFEKAPSPVRLHQWRRRVRRQRMQLQAWQRLTGQGHDARSQVRKLAKLSDALGWRQDLQVLRSQVQRVAEGDELSALVADIREAMQNASL